MRIRAEHGAQVATLLLAEIMAEVTAQIVGHGARGQHGRAGHGEGVLHVTDDPAVR